MHQFYRARTEHYFGALHKWGIIDKTFKGRKLAILKQAVFVLCNIQNMSSFHSFQKSSCKLKV